MSTQTLLIELLTEELPPKALARLSQAFHDGIASGLTRAGLSIGSSKALATPRRLAVVIEDVVAQGQTQTMQRFGPPAANAYKNDEPSQALLGFAKSCGVSLEQVEIKTNDKGQERLYAEQVIDGKTLKDELQSILDATLKALPIPKRMHWGKAEFSFVRPVKNIVALHGETVLPITCFGLDANQSTQGHPVHHPQSVSITRADNYEATLENAFVIADFNKRQQRIETQLKEAAQNISVQFLQSPALLDEVTAIVEWPETHVATFDAHFLQIPEEALTAAMTGHQKVFPLFQDNALYPGFLFVSDMQLDDAQLVIRGNQRVMSARLGDAAYFYQTDLKTPMGDFAERLSGIVFQQKLGTLADKSARVQTLSCYLATTLGVDTSKATQAAALAKADLVSDMVGEFPELQGLMGRYYAQAQDIDPEVATAIEQHYWPLGAGAPLPENDLAAVVSLADKIDNLVGIFGIGLIPTGEKDPFALRRAALGVIRILLSLKTPLVLSDILDKAFAAYGDKLSANPKEAIIRFVHERLKHFWSPDTFSTDIIQAVFRAEPKHMQDAHARAQALSAFMQIPESASLIAANKRASNILKKNTQSQGDIKADALQEPAEKQLLEALIRVKADIQTAADYERQLMALTALKQPLDAFFDSVMVMCDDQALQQQRLNLLGELTKCMNQVGQLDLLQSQGNA